MNYALDGHVGSEPLKPLLSAETVEYNTVTSPAAAHNTSA